MSQISLGLIDAHEAEHSAAPSVQEGEVGASPTVRSIDSKEAKSLIVKNHYSGRTSTIQHAFGLFIGGELVGAVTFGPPASPQVARSCCPTSQHLVIELNRLVTPTSYPNAASILVGRALRLLPKPLVVVSYADQGQGHVGYVYQATNFWYAGSSRPHDSEYLLEGKRVHPRTLAARGITNPRAWAKENGILAVPIEPKHRYIFLAGKERVLRPLVAWPLSRDYPKGNLPRRNGGTDVERVWP